MNNDRPMSSGALFWIVSVFPTRLWVGAVLFLLCLSTTADAQRRNNRRNNKKPDLPYLTQLKTAEEISQIYNKFERFQYQLIGHFSNKEQVDAGTTKEPWQEFIVMPIFQDRPNEFWVYLEFFSPELLDAPIDQRIEQYVQVARDTFRMEVYYLKNPEKYVNAWKMDEFPVTDIRTDLIRGQLCDLIITHQEKKPGTFKTIEPEEITCEMLTSKGAARYVDLEFEVSDDQYLMWFHFYNRKKRELKKSDRRGLIFKRLEYDQMDHLFKEEE